MKEEHENSQPENGAVKVLNPTGNIWSHEAGCLPIIEDAEAGIVSTYPKRKKVAIVGFATSTRSLAPFDDPEWEIWTLNQLYRHVPRADRHFDIHENYEEHVVEGTDHIGWLKECKIPVYMNEYRKEYTTSVRYPIERVIKYFQRDYFTSTIAFMLALAIMEKFKHIAIYGVDLIVSVEYAEQKPCTEYYLGLARGKGITITVPQESALLSQRFRYGYQQRPDDLLCEEDFAMRGTRVKEKRDEMQLKLAILDGAVQEADHYHTTYTSTGDFMTRGLEINAKREELKNHLLLLDGAYQEDLYWSQLFSLRGRHGLVKSSE